MPEIDFHNLLPVAIPSLSFITGLVIFMMREEQHKLRVFFNLASAGLALLMVAMLGTGVALGETFEFRLPLLQDIDLVLHADSLSLLFVVLSSMLWLVTTCYAVGYLENTPHRSRFFGFFSLCVGATIGLALAGNLVTFLIFYELLTIVTYPLVVHRGNAASIKAGRIYLTYTIAGGIALLVGVVWLKSLAGSLDFTGDNVLLHSDFSDWSLRIIFFLLIAGLGVKAALIPLHGWLPVAMAAPAPVSALLHAVAVVKAGAFGIVRVIHDVYGFELAESLGVLTPLVIWACLTIVYGSVRALSQDDLKKRLAFSTVSQVSYIVLGAAMISPVALVGGVVHLVHQGLMKITLFFCAGVYAETLGIHKISEMNGVGKRMPLATLCFTLAALGMIGVPPIAGFVSKWFLAQGALAAGFDWVILVLITSSVLNAAYFLPILHRAWFREQDTEWHGREHENHYPQKHSASMLNRLEAPALLLLPPVFTAVLALASGLLAGLSISPLGWAFFIVDEKIPLGLSHLFSLSGPGPEIWMLLVPAAPIIALLLGKLLRLPHYLPMLAILSLLPALATALFSEEVNLQVPFLLFGSELALNSLSRWWLLLTSVLWLLGAWFAMGYMKSQPRTDSFWLFFMLSSAGNIGLTLAQNPVTFLMFFALMGFSSYGLITHNRTPEAMRAGRWYMRLAFGTEMLLFAGTVVIITASQTIWNAPLNPWLVSFGAGALILGFGVKAGLMPLHLWLPLAHPQAPTPASAVLSGAMIKAGVIGWTRFVPVDLVAGTSLPDILIFLGAGGSIVAALIGMTQTHAKAALAYSSISQMGILALLMGVGLQIPESHPVMILVIAAFAMHHALNKAALFFSVGVLQSELSASARRLVLIATTIPMLSLAGAPLTSGLIAKSLAKDALLMSNSVFAGNLKTLLTFGSLLTAGLMVRYFILVRTQHGHHEKLQFHTGAAWGMSIVCCLLAIPALLWFSHQNLPAAPLEWFQWSALWPVLLAIVSVLGVSWIHTRSRRLPLIAVPPGDLLILLERLETFFTDWQRQRRSQKSSPVFSAGHAEEYHHGSHAEETHSPERKAKSFNWPEELPFGTGLQIMFFMVAALILVAGWL